MADAGGRKPQIPSWQRAQSVQPTPSPGAEESIAPEAPIATSKAPEPGPEESFGEGEKESGPTLDQGMKSLQDEDIRDAPTDQKVAFLESKGFSNSVIQKLLGVSRNHSASSSSSINHTKALPQSLQPDRSSSTTKISSPGREVPPIITYPEFLVKPQNPPPLITARLLLGTAYVAGGIATAIYGLSKYVVAPMSEGLTTARHDFAAHTQNNLDTLNKRLEPLVSEVPPANAIKPKTSESDTVSDVDSIASDPTELFHRDIGTQTSHTLSRRSSLSSASTDKSTKKDAVTGHETRLKIIHSHLSEMLEQSSSDGESAEELSTRLDDLTTYLDGLAYSSSSYYNSGPYGGVSSGLPSAAAGKGDDDAVAKVRAEIRGIKGVLLSAKNFPASGRGLGRVGA